MIAQFPTENHSAQAQFAQLLPLKTIGKLQDLGDYCAIHTSISSLIVLYSNAILGRTGTSFECAMAVVFICVSEYITAETITVDGGWWLGGDRPSPKERAGLEALTRRNEETSRALKPKL
jgi:NAD(P)-dependent dehydrogenase (short-subunit alcohol dehydrogenase family)